jgi:hypothetical protein
MSRPVDADLARAALELLLCRLFDDPGPDKITPAVTVIFDPQLAADELRLVTTSAHVTITLPGEPTKGGGG